MGGAETATPCVRGMCTFSSFPFYAAAKTPTSHLSILLSFLVSLYVSIYDSHDAVVEISGFRPWLGQLTNSSRPRRPGALRSYLISCRGILVGLQAFLSREGLLNCWASPD